MTSSPTHAARLLVLLTGSLALSGCVSNETRPDEPVAEATPAAQAAPQPAVAQAPLCKQETTKSKKKNARQNPACVKAAPVSAVPTSGYNLSKNKPVTDSSKVESGQGTQVKGINDWEGEITGLPFRGSRFTKLKIGMPMQQAFDLVGQPTDQGAYVTGKAFIPFYFGSDKVRWEATYKGQGRLIFSNQAGFGTGQYLTWIIYNANEAGYR
ncbi:MAG: hypothetical protein A2580_08190 [Hydrogenophilales bacterium RIFOXYD1_FULL_62_11]|nr:MAG: hypothetical protein A2580_08190 [Hydrogenophilales bacterium RIFOXYD1_FULL_62_11]